MELQHSPRPSLPNGAPKCFVLCDAERLALPSGQRSSEEESSDFGRFEAQSDEESPFVGGHEEDEEGQRYTFGQLQGEVTEVAEEETAVQSPGTRATSTSKVPYPCWHCGQPSGDAAAVPGGRSFQELLSDLCMEHHRMLAEVKQKMAARRDFDRFEARLTPPEPVRQNLQLPAVQKKAVAAHTSRAQDNLTWRVISSEPRAASKTSRGSARTSSVDESADAGGESPTKERQNKQRKKSLAPYHNRHFSHLTLSDMPAAPDNSKRLSPFDFVVETRKHADGDRMRGHLLELLGWQNVNSVGGLREEKNWVRRMVKTQAFDLACAVAITLNAVVQGWAANDAVINAMKGSRVDEVPIGFQSLTVAFTAWFTLELLMRVYASDRRRCFTRSDDAWMWNIFDGVVVCSDLVHSFMESFLSTHGASSTSENFTVVRMLRVFRITRALRVVRLFRFFRELRMMMYSVLQSGSSLLWSCVLLSFTIYAFAVYFIQICAYHVSADRVVSSTLDERFGNLARAEYSLYLAVSGGISWGELSELFIEIHEVHGIVFCIFIFFTTFAVLNIITGIFVESALSSARSNQEELVQEQMHATAGLLDEMRRIFQHADRNADGSISLDEFETYLDRKEVRAYLDALGVGMEKARGLFELLDLDGSGEITVEEFAFGCLRLKGWAKSIDLATLMNHSRRMAEQFRRFFEWTEGQFKRLHEFESRVDEHLCLFEHKVEKRGSSGGDSTAWMPLGSMNAMGPAGIAAGSLSSLRTSSDP